MAAALRAGGRLPDDRMTVAEWLAAWFNSRAALLRPASQRAYANAIAHLAELLGRHRLALVRPLTVDAALAAMSPGSAPLARSVLSAAYRDAMREGVVDANPVALSRPLRHVPAVPRVPTAAEARQLLAWAATGDARDAAFVTVGLTTGLRVSELCGLLWADIEDVTLTVRRQRYRGVVSEPKTPTSRRTVDLTPAAVAALRRWRLEQARPVGLVFDLDRNTAARHLLAMCRAAGVEPFTPHSMRRFVGQVLSADPKTAATVLGHASARISLDVYARGTDDERRRAAEKLSEVVG